MGALARELREELGIEATVDPTVLFRIESDDMELDAHLVTEWIGQITNRALDEHVILRFVAVRELRRLDLAHPLYLRLLTDLITAQR